MTQWVRVTAIIDHLLSEAVRRALAAAVGHYYVYPARSAHLEERRGLAGLFSDGMRLNDDPSDVFTLFAPAAEETVLLDLIADHGRLHLAGMGSVFSEPVELAHGYAPLLPGPVRAAVERTRHDFYAQLVGITCVVQRGRADRIAREVLELGASVPTIGFGTGMGLRDRLGLLRVTIPAEKELITLVDSRQDADEVIDHIIRAGRLDLPGQGFIFGYPVRRGLLNTRLSRGQVGQAASIDRIAAAIDRLTGGVAWRSAAGARPEQPARRCRQGTDLTLIAPDERVHDLIGIAMAGGARGATTHPLRLITAEEAPHLYKARTACSLFLEQGQAEPVLAALEQGGAFGEEVQAVAYGRRVERAFTYRGL